MKKNERIKKIIVFSFFQEEIKLREEKRLEEVRLREEERKRFVDMALEA